MKKFLLSTFALLAMVSTAFGADKLIVENAYLSTAANTTTDFPVFFSFAEKSSISGVNFSIQLPDGVEFVLDGEDPAYALGTTFDGTPTMSIAGGILKVAMGSSNPIKGANGMLITFRIKPTDASAFSDGQILTGGRIFDATGSKSGLINLDETTFNITVTNRTVLDENSPFAPIAGRNKNVLVKRTLKENTWSTICLPFAMTRDQLEDAFGTDVEIADFTQWSYDDTNGISIGFETLTDGIAYGTPYLIKVSSPISKFPVDGIRIYASTQTAPEIDSSTGEGYYGRMTGNLNVTKMAQYDLFLQDEVFWYANAGQNIKGFRATFRFFDNSDNNLVIPNTSSARAILSINGSAIDDTGINSMILTAKTGKVYSVSGQYMGENVDLKSLPKGVYIVDGNKVVNK